MNFTNLIILKFLYNVYGSYIIFPNLISYHFEFIIQSNNLVMSKCEINKCGMMLTNKGSCRIFDIEGFWLHVCSSQLVLQI